MYLYICTYSLANFLIGPFWVVPGFNNDRKFVRSIVEIWSFGF